MLGPVKGCAVMISPWWHVWETLHVCEGVETALALYERRRRRSGRLSPPDLGARLGGRNRDLPVISRVRHLVIWADNDATERGSDGARKAPTAGAKPASAWSSAIPTNEGEDYAD